MVHFHIFKTIPTLQLFFDHEETTTKVSVLQLGMEIHIKLKLLLQNIERIYSGDIGTLYLLD